MAVPPPSLRLTQSPPDELIEEILLRLPPDEPACLLRASLVCKPWRHIILHHGFRNRLRELHGRPPVLGFLRNNNMAVEDFVATTSSAIPLAVPGDCRALDCRHGRVLLLDMVPGSDDLILWDPITDDEERVPVQAAMWDNTLEATAAIVCAVAGCDHRRCQGTPFHLVMAYSNSSDEEGEDLQWTTWACYYSSETGEWSDVIWIEDSAADFRMHTTSVLVGDSLLYFLSDQGTIIEYEYDLAAGENNAATILPPLELEGNNLIALILTEDGRLGVVDSIPTSRLKIWTWVDMQWVNSRVILLSNLLPAADLGEVCPMSFAERANTLFISTVEGIFTIELHSERARKVCEDDDESDSLVPIETFYTPRAS